MTVSVKPSGNFLESQGGFTAVLLKLLYMDKSYGSLLKCKYGFDRVGVGPGFLLFLPDDVDAVVFSAHFV